MKAFFISFIFFVFMNQLHANDIELLEERVASIENPQAQLNYLQENEKKYLTKDLTTKVKYWLLLGLALEKNDKLVESFQVYSQSIDLLSSSLDSHKELYINSLIQRSYITYIQTYDTKQYCPDRELAYQSVDESISIDLQVRANVQYAFCFQHDKANFSPGLSLLDKALKLAQEHKLSPNTHAMIYNASGVIYGRNQLYSQSYAYLLNAYRQWALVDDYQDMFNMLHSLTHTAINMREYEVAQQHFDGMFALAQEQKAFKDFLFFAHYNSGHLALAKGEIKKGIQAYSSALIEQDNTKENFFVKKAYEANISNYFRLGENTLALSFLSQLTERFPNHQTKSNLVKAFIAYQGGEISTAIANIYEQIDHEQNERRLFLKHAVQSTALLNSQNLTELDKKLLEKTIEIQELNIQKAQTDKHTIYLFLIFALFLILGVSVFSFYLFKTRQYFKYHARIDYLTGVFNRRFLFEEGERAINDLRSKNVEVSILLFDIDNFKRINDTKGHYAGDLAIKLVVEKCQVNLPKGAIIGRLGGDEFLVILKSTQLSTAAEIAEKIRADINQAYLAEVAPIALSVSIGVISCQKHNNLDEAIADADNLLYQAKEKGRNIVVTR
jgi:diguanylate cyclase (GGDEF)-like protein